MTPAGPRDSEVFRTWELVLRYLSDGQFERARDYAAPEFTLKVTGLPDSDLKGAFARIAKWRSAFSNWIESIDIDSVAVILDEGGKRITLPCFITATHSGVLVVGRAGRYPPTWKRLSFSLKHRVTVNDDGKITLWEVIYTPQEVLNQLVRAQ
jgi:hypothetical protein